MCVHSNKALFFTITAQIVAGSLFSGDLGATPPPSHDPIAEVILKIAPETEERLIVVKPLATDKAEESDSRIQQDGAAQIIHVSAAEPAPQCAPFDAVISQAVSYDPRIDEAISHFDIERAELSLAKADRFPQLESFSRAGLGDGAAADNQIDNRVGVRLSQRVFGFGAGRYERRAAKARADSAEFDIATARTTVALETAQAYIAILRAKARRRLRWRSRTIMLATQKSRGGALKKTWSPYRKQTPSSPNRHRRKHSAPVKTFVSHRKPSA